MKIDLEARESLTRLVEQAIEVGKEGTNTKYTAKGMVHQWRIDHSVTVYA